MLRKDYELTPSEVQDLSSLDAVTALFAKLGYDTNARLPQNAGAMGITNEDLRASIVGIERVASNKDVYSSLEVYLFQVKSVTVEATCGVARAFRDGTSEM